MATERIINNHLPPFFSSLHFLVFGSSLVIYNLPVIKNSKDVRRYYSMRGIFFFLGIAFCICSLRSIPWNVLCGAAILAIFSLAYSLPIVPFLNKRSLRQMGWLKTLDLSIVWTMATYVLPVLYWHKDAFSLPFEFLLRFVLIFALCVLFDIRDLQLDLDNNLRTLPQRLGLKISYRLLYVSVSLFVLFSIVQYFRIHMLSKLAGSVITTFGLIWVIRFARKHPSQHVYLGLVDGVMLFYALLVLI